MLNVTPISAGEDGVNYMLRQTSCAEVGERVVAPAGERVHPGAEYLVGAVGRGEPHGRWLGEGLAALGLTAGSVASEDRVRQVFGRLEDPTTGERLGRAPMKFRTPTERLAAALAAEPGATPERRAELAREITSTQRKAVGYYDLTFSPAKSVSVYYAALMVAGRVGDAEKVWEAHRAAVTAALTYLEREAGYSRAGYHGRTKDGRSVGDYVEARHWVAARFDHTTNREHQPQLHSHVELLNRVQCERDGVWRAVDGKALYAEKRAADAVYELTLQHLVEAELPVGFVAREDGKAHEIAGITEEVRDAFSAGAQRIQAQVDEWTIEYAERHGHEPSAYARVLMAERAAIRTRPAKTDGPVDLVGSWAAHHDLAAPLLAAERPDQGVEGRETDRGAVIRAAVREVQQARATWNRSELMLEIKRQLDGCVIGTGETPESVIVGLADEALRPGAGYGVVLLTAPDVVPPAAETLRESDGRSRFRPHRDERYTTEAQLSAEERLVATARALGAPCLTREELVIAEAELAARGLGDDQLAAVLGILGSGRRGDALLGPAGAGKSYTTGALTHLWERHHGPVLGLATSQNAANVLQQEGLTTLNVAAFLARYEAAGCTGLPAEQLPPGALFVIDESGMSATEQLDRVRAIAEAAGAKMLWTGDYEQLDSVGAGGALRLLATDGFPFELTEVHRFAEQWERDASLRLRAGEKEALAEYDSRGRIFEGSVEQMSDAAYQGYLADTLSGKRSLLLVSRNDQAAELSAQVRAKLVELGRVQADGATLRDGTSAGVGDLIQTRRGDWSLVSDTGRAVANRDVWKVTDRTPEGLVVELERDPSVTLTLPAQYVDKDVTLAYASTSHAAQGRTVDTGHSLVDVSMTRGELYPNATRGSEGNWLYTVTDTGRDDERGTPGNRLAVLAEVLDRDTAQHAALQVMAEEIEASRSLASMGTMWAQIVAEQAQDRYSDILLDALGPEDMERLRREHGADRLFRAARDAELAGHDPEVALRAAVERGDLRDADSLSDVLRWRLTNATGTAQAVPASWQERTPEVDSEIGRYTKLLAEAMDQRQADLGERTAEDLPEWANEHLGAVPDEPGARAEWVQRAGAVAGWRELNNVRGPSVLGAAPSREAPDRRAVWDAAYTALGADEAGRDYAAATDDELRAMVDQHEREKDWAPAYVAPLLGLAERGTATNQRQAVLLAAEAAAASAPDVRAERERQAERTAAVAAQLTDRAEQLRVIHEARESWRDHTAPHAEAAEASREELARRDPENVPAPVEEVDLSRPSTTEADLEAMVARSHAATTRILEDWAAQQAAQHAESQRVRDEPMRVGAERAPVELADDGPER